MIARRGKLAQPPRNYTVVDRITSGRLVGLEPGDVVRAEAPGMKLCRVKVEQIRVDNTSGEVTEINVMIYATKTGRPYAKAGQRRVLTEENIFEVVDDVIRDRNGRPIVEDA